MQGDDAWQLSGAFCQELGRRGWLTQAWPRSYGGLEASAWRQAVVAEELWARDKHRARST